jgi:hypothetical protein
VNGNEGGAGNEGGRWELRVMRIAICGVVSPARGDSWLSCVSRGEKQAASLTAPHPKPVLLLLRHP